MVGLGRLGVWAMKVLYLGESCREPGWGRGQGRLLLV